MSKFTSIIPPDIPIPEPPDPIKLIGAAVSVFLSILFVSFILFLFVDFSLEQLGKPIRSTVSSSPEFEDHEPPRRKRVFTAEELLSQFRFVTPLDRVWINGNHLTVLCRWTSPDPDIESPPVQPQLLIDETLVPWTVCFGPDVWLANVVMRSGEHHLRILGKDFNVFFHKAKPKGSADTEKLWKQLIVHEGTDDPNRCDECHVMIEGKADVVRKGRGLTVGPLRPFETCFDCHEPAKVDRRHAKLPEPPSQNCSSCHRLHGDTPNDRKP